jgi:hypothetical protein
MTSNVIIAPVEIKSPEKGVLSNLPTPRSSGATYRKPDLNEAAKAADACTSLSEQ